MLAIGSDDLEHSSLVSLFPTTEKLVKSIQCQTKCTKLAIKKNILFLSGKSCFTILIAFLHGNKTKMLEKQNYPDFIFRKLVEKKAKKLESTYAKKLKL